MGCGVVFNRGDVTRHSLSADFPRIRRSARLALPPGTPPPPVNAFARTFVRTLAFPLTTRIRYSPTLAPASTNFGPTRRRHSALGPAATPGHPVALFPACSQCSFHTYNCPALTRPHADDPPPLSLVALVSYLEHSRPLVSARTPVRAYLWLSFRLPPSDTPSTQLSPASTGTTITHFALFPTSADPQHLPGPPMVSDRCRRHS